MRGAIQFGGTKHALLPLLCAGPPRRQTPRAARRADRVPGDTAPGAGGVIHSDFKRGFIKAGTFASDDLVRCGSVAAARAEGVYYMES